MQSLRGEDYIRKGEAPPPEERSEDSGAVPAASTKGMSSLNHVASSPSRGEDLGGGEIVPFPITLPLVPSPRGRGDMGKGQPQGRGRIRLRGSLMNI